LKKKSIASVLIAVQGAFHSDLLQPMINEYQSILEKTVIKVPNIKIFRNFDLKEYKSKADVVESLT